MPCSDILGLLKLLAVFVLKLLWPLVAAVSPLMSTGSESPNDAAANHAYSFWDSSIQIDNVALRFRLWVRSFGW